MSNAPRTLVSFFLFFKKSLLTFIYLDFVYGCRMTTATNMTHHDTPRYHRHHLNMSEEEWGLTPVLYSPPQSPYGLHWTPVDSSGVYPKYV